MKSTFYIPILLLMMLSGCTGTPTGVTPVSPFELQRYLGQWQEIARLDHSFERGLSDVTATYSLRDDGGVKVINRGFNAAEQTWQQAEGKAYFVGDSDTAALKVSFFGPFYGGYNVAKLSQDYSMALVIGPSLEYAWLLARNKTPAKTECAAFIESATELGIKTADWIWLQQCQ
ncbi:lipocalin family protein [Pseudoalteromonas fenneropenaei]|uniref:Outer membrane lipoprotein Blc n=1 Tax=Pseudoalteromonas fenneropenaei TaxID=1737459 RepID=A0ABV7CG00_9GAMM